CRIAGLQEGSNELHFRPSFLQSYNPAILQRFMLAIVGMKLIVGLGNPGAKYRGTRHNVGFAAVDEMARRAGVDFEAAPADALIAKVRPDPVLFAKPLTFMNDSGRAVAELTRYFKIDI